MSRRLCLVTGASAGIGAALAREYARHGWDVALSARRADRLEALARELKDQHGANTLIVPADLAQPGAPKAVLDAIAAAGRTLDGLVNNAGYGLTGSYVSRSWEEQRALLDVLLAAPAELAHRAFSGMLQRGFGRILNIASVAGLFPATAGHTLYGPAKRFLISLSEALNLEGRGRGVHVCALCPGFTYTEFHDVNGMRAQVSAKVPKWMWKSAEEVAAIGYAACEANVAVKVCGGVNRAMAAVYRLLPDTLGRAISAAQAARYRKTD